MYTPEIIKLDLSCSTMQFYYCRLVHAITPMEENKSFLEKVQMGEKMWSDLQDEGTESLFTSWR